MDELTCGCGDEGSLAMGAVGGKGEGGGAFTGDFEGNM